MALHTHPAFRRILPLTRTLHIYLSLLALGLLFFFAFTGFLLNHDEWFALSNTQTTTSELPLPAEVMASGEKLTLVEYLRAHAAVSGAVQPFDLTSDPIHLTFKSPKAVVDIDIRKSNNLASITTEARTTLALLSQLHTAKYAGTSWRLLIDGVALLLAISSLTGLILWTALFKRRTLGLLALLVSLGVCVITYLLLIP